MSILLIKKLISLHTSVFFNHSTRKPVSWLLQKFLARRITYKKMYFTIKKKGGKKKKIQTFFFSYIQTPHACMLENWIHKNLCHK